MIRTRLLWFLLCLCILPAASAQAATIRAASCSQSDVTAAVASAANGDTVTIPGGGCTWTAPVAISKGIALQGAGQDLTVITGSNTVIFAVNGNSTAFRLSGVGFTGSSPLGLITLDGRFSTARIDHVKFTNLVAPTTHAIVIGYGTWFTAAPGIYPLLDHITYTNNACVVAINQYGSSSSWTAPDSWGSANALYLEDSIITYNVSTSTIGSDCDVLDMESGSRAVVRHNTFINAMVLAHDTGSTGQLRGMRIREIYANTFRCSLTSGVDCGNQAMNLRGGSTIAYDNTIPICDGCPSGSGYQHATFTQIQRLTLNSSHPWSFLCTDAYSVGPPNNNQVANDLRSHCDGGTHPACGTAFENPGQACDVVNTCGGSACGTCIDHPTAAQLPPGVSLLTNFDGTGPGHYPCRDQTGQGRDSADHLTQALTPVYWWNNTDSNNSNAQITTIQVAPNETAYIVADRDYYTYTGSFTGVSGVGRGALSARPTTCTPLTAYYATDTATLYQCTSTNTWTTYYTAFTYPHPLQAGAVPPSPPPTLRVTGVH